MTTNFQKLVKRYARGKTICICKEGYQENCGEGYLNGVHRTDLLVLVCRHGCSANQIATKDYIATMALRELEEKGEENLAKKRKKV